MPLLSLDLNPPSRNKAPAKLPSPGRYLLLTYSTSRRWFPRRGLLFSLLVHEIAIVALMFFFPSSSPRPRVWREKQWDTTMIPKDVLYLPQLGGGSEGGSAEKAGGKASPAAQEPCPCGWRSWRDLRGEAADYFEPPESYQPHSNDTSTRPAQPAHLEGVCSPTEHGDHRSRAALTTSSKVCHATSAASPKPGCTAPAGGATRRDPGSNG